MENYLTGGGTLRLCAHSMYHVQKLCRAALWLKDGRVERSGRSPEVCQAYLAYHEEKSALTKRPTGVADAALVAAAGYYALKSLDIHPRESLPEPSSLPV